MIKIIPPDSWSFDGQPRLELVKVSSTGLRGTDLANFTKRASHPLASWVRESYRPLPGEYVAHLIALGSTEKVGQNRNADLYGEKMLERDHPTFEKYARVYLDHHNRNPARSYGLVKKSHFNKDLGRVELIIALNASKEAAERNGGLIAASTLDKLANNVDVAVSQSCFLPGTLVRMADGTEKGIDQIVMGDQVVTHHGNIGTVNATIDKYHDGEVVKFYATGLPDPVVCTPDHKIWTRPTLRGKDQRCPVCSESFRSLNAHLRQKDDPQHRLARKDYSRYAENWFRAEQLAPGDYVRTPFNQDVESDGDPVYAELLGYYLSEGCTWEYDRFKNSRRDCYKGVDFCFARTETEFVNRVVRLCTELGYTKITIRNQKSRPNSTEVRVSSADLAERLLRDGGRYAGGKKIAADIMRWSPRTQLKIVARFIDGDGHWSKINENLSGTTVSRQLAFDLATICWRNGIAATITRSDKSKPGKPRQPVYVLVINQRDAHKIGSDKFPADFIPTLRCPTVLGHLNFQPVGGVSTRSAPALKTYVENGFIYRRIRKVERADYCGTVHDISVPGDTSYTVFGVAVSNCTVPGDYCNSCDHFARNRSEYCGPENCKYGGCRDNLGRVFDDGFQLGVDNRDCRFFDISDVSRTRGADRTAFITGKVAVADRVIGGAELGEMLGLVAPDHILDPSTLAAVSSLRKLAGCMLDPNMLPASSWNECLTIRAKRANGFSKSPEFPHDDAGRHVVLAELARDGVILPPSRWLAAATGAPLDKCAAVFAKGVDPKRLLDASDLHEKIADATYGDSRISPPGSYSWMAPTPGAHAEESACAVITGPSKIASAHVENVPENVREAACLHYLAYQAGVLAKHAHTPRYPVMLAECARHNIGVTM